MAELSRLLNKVFLLSRKKSVTVARGERERMEQGIPRRSKGSREGERMSEKDRETGRSGEKIDGEHGGVRTMEGKRGRECETSTLENQAASLFPREAARLAVAD